MDSKIHITSRFYWKYASNGRHPAVGTELTPDDLLQEKVEPSHLHKGIDFTNKEILEFVPPIYWPIKLEE